MPIDSNVVPHTPFFAEQKQPGPGHELEHPTLVVPPADVQETPAHRDTLDATNNPPLYCCALNEAVPSLSVTALEPARPAHSINHKKLTRLRKRPAAQLLAHSVLSLKAYQLDMDCPRSLRSFVREQLRRFLREQTGKELSPDTLLINFNTEAHPAVLADGREDYRVQRSLTDLGLASFDGASFLALIQCAVSDQTLYETTPPLTADKVIDFVRRAPWAYAYKQRLDEFWTQQGKTWCSLAKLAFLDGIAQQFAQKKLSRDGYQLALDALGLLRFPDTLDELDRPAIAGKSIVSMVSFKGLILPGVFQLKSRTTSHCFIHVLGNSPATFEYISHEQDWMRQKLLDALNAAPWLAPCLNTAPTDDPQGFETVLVEGDLFSALSDAQHEFLIQQVDEPDIDLLNDLKWGDDDLLLKPIERSLAMISSLDLCEAQPKIFNLIPNPLQTARDVMRRAVQNKLGMRLEPDQVFLRYLPGTSKTPLGNAFNPANQVHVPDEKPISLSQALLSNYRVEQPIGYLDNGGRTAVYLDVTGKGQWSQASEIDISAEAIQRLVDGIDFLPLMSARLEQFWDEHREAIEQTLRATFIAQAVLALKQAQLTRAGFDLLVEMLDAAASSEANSPITRKALGFYLQSSVIDGAHGFPGAGLLLFSHRSKPLQVLYQAGQQQTFVELSDSQQLDRHLAQASKVQQWRMTLANYWPISLRPRLHYILEVWAGQRTAGTPSSNLRPWTHALYANHLHKAEARVFCEQAFTESPFVFMRNQLKQQHQDNANDQIVTSTERSLRYWSDMLNHLQLLLMPMSLLLTPAAVAALAAQAARLGIDIAASQLPGNRDAEKKQLVVNAFLFGLLQLGPLTPRLLRAFGTFTQPAKPRVQVTTTATRSRGLGAFISRSVNPRKTRLEKFFHTDSVLKTWDIPGHPSFGTLPLKGWKLGHQFLLWTSARGQARNLVVSTHGYYLPWTRTTAIPNGTELRTYAPHGFALVDPGLHRVVSQRTQPFSILTTAGNTPGMTLPAYTATDNVLAGTSLSGRIKNYTLSKFQSAEYESYPDISRIVLNSNQRPWHRELPTVPMDVLTVRNRFGMRPPSLEDLFRHLFAQGIHYDRILLVHCRCSAIYALMKRPPSYHASSTGPQVPLTP